MPSAVLPPRIAIGQLQMHWSIEENTSEILRAIARAAHADANVIALPELALTGFHRNIVALAKPEIVAPHLQAVQAACAQHRVACAIGAPTFRDQAIFNSVVFIDARGEIVGVVEKNGLTAAEETFFTRGTERAVFQINDLQISAVLCIEIHDIEDIVSELAKQSVDLIVWPGIMRPDPSATQASAERHVHDAKKLARACGAWIVQANWPNSLNYPVESEFAGQSIVIDPDGETLLRLPVAAYGVGVFDLGSKRFNWFSLASHKTETA
jgi:omega-amidase